MIYLDHAGAIETKEKGRYIRPNVFEYKIEPGVAELCIFNPYYYNQAKKEMQWWANDISIAIGKGFPMGNSLTLDI